MENKFKLIRIEKETDDAIIKLQAKLILKGTEEKLNRNKTIKIAINKYLDYLSLENQLNKGAK